MKNYIAPGDVITITAPAAVSAGDGVQLGSIVGIATADAGLGDALELALTGVYDVAKTAADTFSEGVAVYWDNVAGEFTTTADAPNVKVGVAVLPVAGPAATVGRVRLNGRLG